MAGGVGGVHPQIQKRGRVAHSGNPTTSGTQNAGEPSANEGGQKGGQGGKAPMAVTVPHNKPWGGGFVGLCRLAMTGKKCSGGWEK